MNLFSNSTEIMLTKNYKIMNSIYKLLLVFTMFICSLNGYSQYADPGIGIIINPISVTQGGTGILSANVGNYGNSTIVANSLMVTITVGSNSEILGIATGSDARWTQFSLTPSSGNTMILKNTLGGFDSFDIGDILLTVRGNSVSDLDLITGDIGYITAGNPQGNASNTNDYSQTSLIITPPTCTSPNLTVSSAVCNGTTYYVSFNSNGTVTASAGTIIGNTVTGIVVGTNVILTSAAINGCGASTQTTVQSPASCTMPPVGCTTPIISAGNGVCSGIGTYSVSVTVSAGAQISASAGVVSGNSVTGITLGTAVTITATSGTCTSSVTVSSPTDCTTPCLATAVSYSIGSCIGNTYSVSITNPSGASIVASAGTVTSTAIINIPVGTNVTVTATITGCTAQTVTLNAPVCCELTAPTLSVVTQPTCSVATGSFTIINYNAAYTYAVIPATGVTIVGNTVTAPAGSYTVTASTGTCTSPASAPAVINAQPTTLVTPTLSVVTQPTCSVASGSFTITNYNVANTYNVTPTTGVTIVGNTVTAPSGIYTVTASSGACTSPASAPAVINLFNNTSCASIALIKTAHHDDFNHDGFAQAGENIIYTFVITNTGLVPLTNITINDPLPGVIMSGGPISLGVGGVDSTSFTGVYTITTQDVINESVTNQATVYGTSPTGGIVNDLSDSTSITGDNGTVLPIKACKVDVFNAVTPNNDGNNDYLFIKGLDCYTDNSIEIYNRWGVKVYETQGYDNSIRVFRGYSEGRVTINKSEPLPNGTYYYVLKYKDFNGNGLTKTGFLYLTL